MILNDFNLDKKHCRLNLTPLTYNLQLEDYIKDLKIMFKLRILSGNAA